VFSLRKNSTDPEKIEGNAGERKPAVYIGRLALFFVALWQHFRPFSQIQNYVVILVLWPFKPKKEELDEILS
jgi:hypothetical protein